MIRIAKILLAGLFALGIALMPTAANAAGLDVDYDASGSSYIASTGSTVDIAPTTLSTTIESADGSITGHMPLKPATSEFKIIGLLPVKATVHFDEAAPITGSLINEGNTTRVESTASYYIRLSDVRVAGLPVYVGDKCQTKDPVSIPANTPEGEQFDIVNGGELHGEYTIGDFHHCFIQTWLLNLLIPGSGNTVDLNVTNGRLG